MKEITTTKGDSMSQTQSEATINCILNLCTEMEYKHSPKETIYKDLLTKDDITKVVNFITAGMINGDITMTDKSHKKFDKDHKALRRYTVGLVNDRLRKAKVLNGNTTYKYKNPGKLTSARDPELKALMQTIEIVPKEHVAEVQKEIDRRKAELATKKTVEIDYNLLSPELRKTLGI